MPDTIYQQRFFAAFNPVQNVLLDFPLQHCRPLRAHSVRFPRVSYHHFDILPRKLNSCFDAFSFRIPMSTKTLAAQVKRLNFKLGAYFPRSPSRTHNSRPPYSLPVSQARERGTPPRLRAFASPCAPQPITFQVVFSFEGTITCDGIMSENRSETAGAEARR